MQHSSLEITGNEYLIRLKKEDFELSFINQLLKRIQSEHYFFSRTALSDMEEDILSRHTEREINLRYDNLDEK